MKRIYFALIAAIFVLASCEEWDQVFTTDYGKADVYEPVTMTPNTTIAQLKALYKSGPVKIEKDIVIGGQVVSEDRSGNVYKSIYIQDATGGIELKIGKNALYNDYKLMDNINNGKLWSDLAIDEANRLIFRIDDGQLVISSCMGHYE